jgi:pimeloyl-ACP methyl ester carboxylesterase
MNTKIEFVYLITNGVRLHTAQAGPADGPLVILLHGFPEFWYGWRGQIEPLASAGYRVVAPDQRGYNLSEVPKGVKAYRMDELVKDVIGLVDVLGYENCYLVGHDWGAAVAWSVALSHPSRVGKLAILNVPHPAVMLDFLKKNPRQMLKSWYIAFFQIHGLADWLVRQNDFQQAAASLRGSSQPGTFSDEDIAEYKKAWKNSAGLTGMINWYRALARFRPSMPADPRLRMPVCILWGKRDDFLSYQMAELSAKLCDQGRLTFFDQATHWVQHEEAHAVSQALIEFFGA